MIRTEKRTLREEYGMMDLGENTMVANVKVDWNINVDFLVNAFLRRMIRVYIELEKEELFVLFPNQYSILEIGVVKDKKRFFTTKAIK